MADAAPAIVQIIVICFTASVLVQCRNCNARFAPSPASIVGRGMKISKLWRNQIAGGADFLLERMGKTNWQQYRLGKSRGWPLAPNLINSAQSTAKG